MNFETGHSLFSVPVIEDENDYDNIEDITCDLQRNPQRAELINAAKVLIYDEAFSSDKYLYNAILKSYNGLKGKVILLLMDRGQTAPIVKHSTREQTVNASILRHPIWSRVHRFTFTVNLRLLALENIDENDEHFLSQRTYAQDLTEIRTNGPFRPNSSIGEVDSTNNELTGMKILSFKGFNVFTDINAAISFLYPQQFNTSQLEDRGILATTNEICFEWNQLIQKMNPNILVHLHSANAIEEVDDPYGILQSMLNSDTLEFYRKPGIPEHILQLKVGDLCFLLRTVSKKDFLSKNTRVRILKLSRYKIQVQTLGNNAKVHNIPRMKFRVTHNFGFTLLRTQFPLGLAYAMTKNKAQGQKIPWLLNDVRSPVFAHGQQYVAFSRANDKLRSAVLADECDVLGDYFFFNNIVYPELFE
jgi:hypothetical protein